MGNNKNQLVVAAIENGTVIDHIPAEKTYQVVNLLQLEKMETPVTIGYNLPSKKIGKKGILVNAVNVLLNFLLNEDEGIKILKTERGIPASKHAYDLLQKEGMVDDLVKSAHESIMAADPMYFSPKFDNAKLKGNNAAYIDVFSGVSYGEYSVEDGAKTLYDTYKEVCGD